MQFKENIGETEVTRAVLKGWNETLEHALGADVIIVGAGPSGLMAGKELSQGGLKVVVLERNNYLGGGFWIGGYLMNRVTFRAPAQEVLDEIGCPYDEVMPGLYAADGPHACSKLIAAACDAGVRFLQVTSLEDVVVREGGRVAGAVINWMPIELMPPQISCLDPIALECNAVIDSSGHDAVAVHKLEKRGLFNAKGMGAMWVEQSEDALVEHTGEVAPGLFVAGIAVCEAYGLPRMGPTFGAMLLSGMRVAELVSEKIGAQAAV